MAHIDSLNGHGWPKYHENDQQVTLWYGLDYSRTLFDPDKLGLYDREVFTGWEIGSGPEATCYVLYCRAEEEEEGKDDEDASDTDWQWRYVINRGRYGVEAFDNVVELLEWYEELNVPDLENLKWYSSKVF